MVAVPTRNICKTVGGVARTERGNRSRHGLVVAAFEHWHDFVVFPAGVGVARQVVDPFTIAGGHGIPPLYLGLGTGGQRSGQAGQSQNAGAKSRAGKSHESVWQSHPKTAKVNSLKGIHNKQVDQFRRWVFAQPGLPTRISPARFLWSSALTAVATHRTAIIKSWRGC